MSKCFPSAASWSIAGMRGERRRRARGRATVRTRSLVECRERRTLLSTSLFDPSFGGGTGVVTTDVGPGNDAATAVAAMPDGRLLVAGRNILTGRPPELAVARYNVDGTLDKTYGGGDGKLTLAIGSGFRAAAVAALPSGKALVAGTLTGSAATGTDFALVRLNADGSLDKTFGGAGSGVARTGVGAGAANDVVRAMAVRPGGTILVAGTTTAGARPADFAVVRYTAAGAPDTTFGGGDGIVTTDFAPGAAESDDAANAIALGPGGTFVLAGSSDGDVAVARYTAGGALDPTFSGDGKLTAAVSRDGSKDDAAVGVAVLGGGQIVVDDHAEYSPDTVTFFDTAVLLKFRADGTPDTSFGSGGRSTEVSLMLPVSSTEGGMAVLPDGKIVVAGGGFELARFSPQGLLDPSFGGTGVYNGFNYYYLDVQSTSRAAAVIALPDGRPVVVGSSEPDPFNSKGITPVREFAVVRYKNPLSSTGGDPDDRIATARSIAVGGSVADSVSSPTDVDLYKVTVQAGQILAFDVDRAGGALDSYLRVFNADGKEIAANDDAAAPGEPAGTSESYLRVSFAAAGTYYVGVSGSANGSYDPASGAGDVSGSTGAYRLLASKVTPPADPDDQITEVAPLAVSGTRSAAIDQDLDVDLYKFTLAGNQQVSATVTRPLGSRLSPALQVFGPDGNPVASAVMDEVPGNAPGTSARVQFVAAKAGTYFLGVSAAGNTSYDPLTGNGDRPGGSSGAYTLSLANVPGDPDDQIAEARSLPPAGVSGAISFGADVDMYKFTVPAGPHTAEFHFSPVPGSGLEPVLRVFDAQGREIVEPFELVPTLDASVPLETGGTYYVGFSGAFNEYYDPVSGVNDYDSNYSGGMGAYRLSLKLVAGGHIDDDDQFAEARPLPIGAPVSGAIGQYDVDMFTFNVIGTGPVLYSLTGQPSDPGLGLPFDPLVTVFDASGRSLHVSSPPGTLSIPGPGKYYLAVSSIDNSSFDPVTGLHDGFGGTGTYTLELYQPPANDPDDQIDEATPAALGSTKTGSIDNPIDVDMYAFQAVGGRGVAIDLDPSTMRGLAASRLFVFDSDGRFIAFDRGSLAPGETPTDFGLTGDSYLEFFAPRSGTYYLSVSAADNENYDPLTGRGDTPAETGGYRVTFSALPADADPDNQIAEAVGIAAPGTQTGNISNVNDIDFVKVTVAAGQRLGFDIDLPTGSKLDPLLRLFNGLGEEIGISDNDPAPGERLGVEAYLEHTFQEAGTYYVGTSSHDNHVYDPASGLNQFSSGTTTGAYVLRVTKLA